MKITLQDTLSIVWQRMREIQELQDEQFWPRCRAIEQAAIERHPDARSEIVETVKAFAERLGKLDGPPGYS